jgi:hypothetical protein
MALGADLATVAAHRDKHRRALRSWGCDGGGAQASRAGNRSKVVRSRQPRSGRERCGDRRRAARCATTRPATRVVNSSRAAAMSSSPASSSRGQDLHEVVERRLRLGRDAAAQGLRQALGGDEQAESAVAPLLVELQACRGHQQREQLHGVLLREQRRPRVRHGLSGLAQERTRAQGAPARSKSRRVNRGGGALRADPGRAAARNPGRRSWISSCALACASRRLCCSR